MLLIFLPNLGMGGSPVADTTAAGKPGRRRYTLPDGRRVRATQEEIRRILQAYTSQTESDLSKVELPAEVEVVEDDIPEVAPSQLFAPLVALAEEIGPQLVMEITDDLTQEEAIALGRMIESMEEDEAVLALLLLN